VFLCHIALEIHTIKCLIKALFAFLKFRYLCLRGEHMEILDCVDELSSDI
jgi:hypothetical protein